MPAPSNPAAAATRGATNAKMRRDLPGTLTRIATPTVWLLPVNANIVAKLKVVQE
jgi:hypothetical protein